MVTTLYYLTLAQDNGSMLSGYVSIINMTLYEKIDISRCTVLEKRSRIIIQNLAGAGFGGIDDIVYIACCTLTATTGCLT
jgi:hypothetical protein